MRTLEQIVYDFLQRHGEAMLANHITPEGRAALFRLNEEMRPHIALISDANPQDVPPFDYTLLAGFNPKMLMMILLQAVGDTFVSLREC